MFIEHASFMRFLNQLIHLHSTSNLELTSSDLLTIIDFGLYSMFHLLHWHRLFLLVISI